MTARPLISLASLLPGTPTLPRQAVRPGSATPNATPNEDTTMPRRKGITNKALNTITDRPGITPDQLAHALDCSAAQTQSIIWALKRAKAICSTGGRGARRLWPGKKPPKDSDATPAAREPSRFIAPAAPVAAEFPTPTRAPILHDATNGPLELIRTAVGDVLVIAGDTITHRIPAAVAEAIRHAPHL